MNHAGSGGNADLYSEFSHFMWVRTQQLRVNYGCGCTSHTFGILVSGCTRMHVYCNLCFDSKLQFTCVCVQPDSNSPNV